MLQDFLLPFITITLAELGDKTQIAILCLAGKTKKHLDLFFGAMLAFIIVDGLAILLGGVLSKYVPVQSIKIGSAVLFIVFGFYTILSFREEEAECALHNPFISAFTLILFSEMGDKTQIAAGLFALDYNPWIVFAGVIAALAMLTATAIYAGRFILEKVDKKTVAFASGIIFIIIGIVILTGAF